jgi:hypothetical protein
MPASTMRPVRRPRNVGATGAAEIGCADDETVAMVVRTRESQLAGPAGPGPAWVGPARPVHRTVDRHTETTPSGRSAELEVAPIAGAGSAAEQGRAGPWVRRADLQPADDPAATSTARSAAPILTAQLLARTPTDRSAAPTPTARSAGATPAARRAPRATPTQVWPESLAAGSRSGGLQARSQTVPRSVTIGTRRCANTGRG